jgi:hypothetical protein
LIRFRPLVKGEEDALRMKLEGQRGPGRGGDSIAAA